MLWTAWVRARKFARGLGQDFPPMRVKKECRIVKRTDLLGIAVLLLPLGGCALNPAPSAATSAQSAKATPIPDAKTAAMQPTDIESAVRSAQATRKGGDLVGATRILSQLVLIAPDDARVLGEYGKTLAAQGRSDDALAFLERAAQIEPNDWSLFSAQGVALDQKGNYPAAQTFYARALMLKPGEPSVLNNSALSHMQSGDLDGAEQLLRQAMPGSPDDARIAQNLALVQSLKAAQPPKAMAAATPAPAPVQMASITPPPPAPAPAQIAAPLPAQAPVVAATLDTPPAAPVAKTEPKAVEVLKADPTVRMQALPKEAQTTLTPHQLPAKPEAAPVPKPVTAAASPATPAMPAEKAAAAASTAPAPKVAAKAAVPTGAAPKLITAAARTTSASAFYVQAGSYPTEAGAGQAASGLDSMGARVMSGTVNGHAVYRVRIGPFLNIRQANAAIEQAHALGHADVVIVTE
jgi:Flp pilus assembly protein TadD/cell division protein FtsN